MDFYKFLAVRNKALRANDIVALRALVEGGWKADSLLRMACTMSSPETCEALVGMGASSGFMVGYSDTALHLAVKANRVDVCRALVRAGADPLFTHVKCRQRFSPLVLAVREQKVGLVRFFVLECRIDPAPVRTIDGRSLRQIAAQALIPELRSLKIEFDILGSMGCDSGALAHGARLSVPAPI
jgi:ankyrin repeat protein